MTWNNELETEYQAVLKIMQTQIKLSPYNPSKKLKLVIDGASSIGTGFILVQLLDENHQRRDATLFTQDQAYYQKASAR